MNILNFKITEFFSFSHKFLFLGFSAHGQTRPRSPAERPRRGSYTTGKKNLLRNLKQKQTPVSPDIFGPLLISSLPNQQTSSYKGSLEINK